MRTLRLGMPDNPYQLSMRMPDIVGSVRIITKMMMRRDENVEYLVIKKINMASTTITN